MGCRPRMALRWIMVNFALPLVLACHASIPGGRSPGTELPSAWSTPACLVEDRTATTADTILVIGAGASVGATAPASLDCEGFRWPSRPAPVVLLEDAPMAADGRDILEFGLNGRRADVYITRAPAVLDYARQRGAYVTTPLPWRTTYVLMGAHSTADARPPSVDERHALARDAVTVDARGAAEPFPWLADSSCAIPARSHSATAPVIAYLRDDPVARALAARVVSLTANEPTSDWLSSVASDRSSGPLRAIPMSAASIPAALAEGRLRAAVLPIQRDPRARCGFQTVGRLHAGALPLVDTREHVIVRRGSGAAFLVAPDGSLYFFRRDTR